MKKWPPRFRLAAISAGCIFLPGCSSLPAHQSYAAPATRVYVISDTFTSILEYSTASADNGSLMSTLTLPASFWGYVVATDSVGQIYVSGVALGIGCRILVYPADSTGVDVPSRTLELAGESCPAALAVDPARRLYVAGQALNGVPPTIAVYSATASGTATPLRTVTLAAIGTFSDLAADAAGNIYAASTSAGDGPFSIQVYSSTSTGTALPVRTITSSAAVGINGVAVDAAGDIFAHVQLNNIDHAIQEFAPNVDGPAVPTNTISLPAQSAVTAQGGPVRIDRTGNLFVSLTLINNATVPGNESYVIYGFAPTSTGSPTPTTKISPANVFFNNQNFALN